MPNRLTTAPRTILLTLTLTLLSSCTVVKVADLTASTAIGVTVGTAKLTGKAIGAAIPDGDEKEKEDQTKKNPQTEK